MTIFQVIEHSSCGWYTSDVGEFSFFVLGDSKAVSDRINQLARSYEVSPYKTNGGFGKYIYHTSVGWKCGKTTLTATEVKKFTHQRGSCCVTRENLDLRKRIYRHFNKSNGDFQIKFSLVDYALLTQHEDMDRSGPSYFASCVIVHENSSFRVGTIIEQYPPPFQTSYPRGGEPDLNIIYKASASYIRPSWFDQRFRDHVVFPYSDVSSFFSLALKATDHLSSSLTLTTIKVALVCTIFKAKRRRDVDYTYILNKSLHPPSVIFTRNSQERGERIPIPKHLFKCQIPSIPPSFSDGKRTLSYALRFTIGLRDEKNNKFGAEAVININVATKEPVRLEPCCRHLHEDCDLWPSVYFLDRQRIEDLDAQAMGNDLFTRLGYHEVEYHYFETTTFTTEKTVTSLTKVRYEPPTSIRGPRLHTWIEAIACKIGERSFGYNFESKKQEPLILLKSYHVKDIQLEYSTTIGCAVVLEDEMAFPISFSSSYSFTNKFVSDFLDSEHKERPMTFPSEGSSDKIFMSLEFCQTSPIVQSEGEFIVTPGVRLREFLKMKLSMMSDKFESLDRSASISIKQIIIYLVEFHHAIPDEMEYSPLVPYRKAKYLMLEKKVVNLRIKRDEFVKAAQRNTFQSIVHENLLDICIPQVGPTYFTNFLSREYSVYVQITAKVDQENDFSLEALHQIKIAAPPEELTFANISPPTDPEVFVEEFQDRTPGHFRFKRNEVSN